MWSSLHRHGARWPGAQTVCRPPDAVAEPSGWRPTGPCPITPAPSLSMLPVVGAHCSGSPSSSGCPILSGTARVEQKPSYVGRGQCRRIHLMSKPGDILCLFVFLQTFQPIPIPLIFAECEVGTKEGNRCLFCTCWKVTQARSFHNP